MSYFEIINPGVLSLIQDQGRFGQSQLGLSNGGPLDAGSARWANALLNNPSNASIIECSIGGLQLHARCDTVISITGAQLPVTINGNVIAMWQSHAVQSGDIIELGMVSRGLRAYVAVAGGFNIEPQFGSTSTVMREGIGGQHQNGSKLQTGDTLALMPLSTLARSQWPLASLPPAQQPDFDYRNGLKLRLIEGYQHQLFSEVKRQRFYFNRYQVTPQADRMGVKLSGAAIQCSHHSLLSEGICYGAVQIPPDGQPIVLLNDRQTLGGYPKIGSVLSLDCWQLAQAPAGTEIQFIKIDPQQAHNILLMAHARFRRLLAAVTNQSETADDHN